MRKMERFNAKDAEQQKAVLAKVGGIEGKNFIVKDEKVSLKSTPAFNPENTGQRKETLKSVGAVKGRHFIIHEDQITFLKPKLVFNPESIEQQKIVLGKAGAVKGRHYAIKDKKVSFPKVPSSQDIMSTQVFEEMVCFLKTGLDPQIHLIFSQMDAWTSPSELITYIRNFMPTYTTLSKFVQLYLKEVHESCDKNDLL